MTYHWSGPGESFCAWRIGSAVEKRPPRPNIHIILAHQLLPEHAEALSKADVAVFIDCSAVSAAGQVSTIRVRPAVELPRILTHHLDPASLLRMAQEFFGHAPASATLVTVGGESFAHTDELSPAVEAAIPAALQAVYDLLLQPALV